MDWKKMTWAVLALGLALPGVGRTEDSTPKESLEQEFGVPAARVQELRDKGMGWGEIGHALAISQKSGKPLSEILADRDAGMGWGEIARKYGFKLGEVRGKAKEFVRRVRGDDRLSDRERKGDKDAVPDRDSPREVDKNTVKEDEKAKAFAKEYGVEEKAILALRDDGYGWGEVRHALDISKKAGVPLSEVSGLRDGGMGWGQIAKKYGFNLGDVTGKGKAGDKAPARDKGKGPGMNREHGPSGSGHGNGHAYGRGGKS